MAKNERRIEDDAFKDEIHLLSDKFGDVSSASIPAAFVLKKQPPIRREKEHQLIRDADEPETVRVLFNDDEDDNKIF